MAIKLVCLLISSYLLLTGDYHVVSGFTPVNYSDESSSTECGQSDPLQDAALVSHWEHISRGSLRELMGSSRVSPDKICFEEGCILEDLAADGPD